MHIYLPQPLQAREVTMVVLSENQIQLCYKLWRRCCFGNGHMLIDNLINGFPTNLQSIARESLNDLIRKNIVRRKPTRHGYAVYLNLDHRNDIEKVLRKKYGFI